MYDWMQLSSTSTPEVWLGEKYNDIINSLQAYMMYMYFDGRFV